MQRCDSSIKAGRRPVNAQQQQRATTAAAGPAATAGATGAATGAAKGAATEAARAFNTVQRTACDTSTPSRATTSNAALLEGAVRPPQVSALHKPGLQKLSARASGAASRPSSAQEAEPKSNLTGRMGRSVLPLPLLVLAMALSAFPVLCSGQVQLSYTSTLLPGVGNATCGWYTMQFTTWCNSSAQTYITAHDVRDGGGSGDWESVGCCLYLGALA